MGCLICSGLCLLLISVPILIEFVPQFFFQPGTIYYEEFRVIGSYRSRILTLFTGLIIVTIIGVILILLSIWIYRKNNRKPKKKAIKEIRYPES